MVKVLVAMEFLRVQLVEPKVVESVVDVMQEEEEVVEELVLALAMTLALALAEFNNPQPQFTVLIEHHRLSNVFVGTFTVIRALFLCIYQPSFMERFSSAGIAENDL